MHQPDLLCVTTKTSLIRSWLPRYVGTFSHNKAQHMLFCYLLHDEQLHVLAGATGLPTCATSMLLLMRLQSKFLTSCAVV